jgi:hypothetical protein
MRMHEGHESQASSRPSPAFSQFNTLAIFKAASSFPAPSGPLKSKLGGTRLLATIFLSRSKATRFPAMDANDM